MNEQVRLYMEKYPKEIVELFSSLRQVIIEKAPLPVEEMLWSKLPSYYVGKAFVRLIPFKDHVNIEAKAVLSHKEELKGYKITPKGMLQIFLEQELPLALLREICMETFLIQG